MKDIFLFWITLQLFVIGIVGGDTLWKIKNNQYDCQKTTQTSLGESIFVSAIIPLMFFIDSSFDKNVDEYCSRTPQTSATSTKQ